MKRLVSYYTYARRVVIHALSLAKPPPAADAPLRQHRHRSQSPAPMTSIPHTPLELLLPVALAVRPAMSFPVSAGYGTVLVAVVVVQGDGVVNREMAHVIFVATGGWMWI